MNRLTAIGLASLVAYGLLIASKYTGLVSAAREDRPATRAAAPEEERIASSVEAWTPSEAAPRPVAPLPRPTPVVRHSATYTDYRASRDLKIFADGLMARRDALSADERYYLARALEECHFALGLADDLRTYSARQRRQFLATLPPGDPNNAKRLAAYDAVDNTQRCAGFQDARISPKDIEGLYRNAAAQGDARAQARMVTAELGNKHGGNRPTNTDSTSRPQESQNDDMQRIISLLESQNPEALIIVGEFLARQSSQLRVGPNHETPEPSAFLGGFSLVACDVGLDCSASHREPLNACAYAGYCNAQSFEELYQNYLASPWAYTQALRYRMMIHTAIRDRNWELIGLTPKRFAGFIALSPQ